nr:putative ribonuclease H-like domain-containing protein [Tanacetum cinerariifolium]
MGFMVYQMDVKTAFLYRTIKEEVYVCQPSGFENPDYPDKVYKVVKALYGLNQAPKAWYETLTNYLWDNGFQKGKIDQTLFIKLQKGDILLVQIYVDDIIFVARIEAIRLFLAYASFMGFMVYQMDVNSSFLYGTIEEEVYVCQPLGFEDPDYPDKVYKVVKALYGLHQAPRAWKFGLTNRKSASTPIDTKKPLLKDPDGVNTPRSDDDRLELMELTVFLLPSDEKVEIEVSAVDPQFWTFVAMKKVNDITRLQALVDKKKVVITEASIRDALCLDDAEGIECLPNDEIFAELARTGYEKLVGRLLSLAEMVLGVALPLIAKSALVASYTILRVCIFFAFSASALSGDAEVNVDYVPAVGVAAEGVVSAANDEVPTADDEPSIPSPTPPTPPPQSSQDVPSTSQHIPVSIDKSQVVTFNGEFVCGFRSRDCGTGSQSDNTVGNPYGFVIHEIKVFKGNEKVKEVIDVEN